MAYASELDMDVRPLWLHAFVLWLEHEPVLDEESQERIRAALKPAGLVRVGILVAPADHQSPASGTSAKSLCVATARRSIS